MPPILVDVPWAVALIVLPVGGGIASFLWPRQSVSIGLVTVFVNSLLVIGLGWQMHSNGIYQHNVGGWGAPIGIELFADGLSLLMLSATAIVAGCVSVYSSAYFTREQAVAFWPLWLLALTALNALFLSADIFNLYVSLELMALAAVALTALAGGRDALNGAMRYLLATLVGSLAYLFGVALLYHGFGTVDIATLATRVTPVPVLWVAMGLIIAGLALKTALFPLYFWLPPAHASAPAPVSALLSALVVKASFYILLRLWLELFSSHAGAVDQLLGGMGAAAVLWGSIQALRQSRLKLLVAYSTVAQIGYLFLAFPLASNINVGAWKAVSYLALSHAVAKAAMFLAAGNLLRFGGHDRIADLDRVVQRLPLTAAAFALAGVSIMGLPPSGGFVGKWLLLHSALLQGRWDLVVVILLGGLLAASYVFKVLGCAFTEAPRSHEPSPVPARMEWAALILAIAAILLGFLSPAVFSLLRIGSPFALDEAGL